QMLATQVYSLNSIFGAFNAGSSSLRDRSAALVSQALGLDLPVVQESIDQALDLAGKFAQPFNVSVLLDTAKTAAIDQLTQAGFTDIRLDITPDANGDLLHLTRTLTWNSTTGAFSVGGSTGFSYFDNNVRGQLLGTFLANAPTITFQVTFGVDVLNGTPS